MPTPTDKVNKAMSPEETALVSTIQSACTELLQLNQTEAGPAEVENTDMTAVTEALKKLAGEDVKPEEDSIEKEDNGPTANDSAEERIDIQTQNNDENLSEVGKALINAILNGNKTQVAKSASIGNPVAEAIAKIEKSLIPLVNKVNAIEKSSNNLIDALGFAEKIEKALPAQQLVEKSNIPVQSVDATAVMSELLEVMKSMRPQNPNPDQPMNNDWHGHQDARKDLREGLNHIFSGAIERNTQRG